MNGGLASGRFRVPALTSPASVAELEFVGRLPNGFRQYESFAYLMSDLPDPDAIEQERQDLLRQFLADSPQSLTADYGPGSFGCHELLDRTALIVQLLHEQIIEHPSCIQEPSWFALAHEAAAILSRLYQDVGREHLEHKVV